MNREFIWFSLIGAIATGSLLGNYAARRDNLQPVIPKAATIFENAKGDSAKLSEAADLIRGYLKQDAKNLSALLLQGRIEQQRGFPEAALAAYETFSAQAVSDEYAAHFNAGELYELRSDLQKAEKHFVSCIGVAPEETAAWERLILVLLKQKKIDEAKEYLDSFEMMAPGSNSAIRLRQIIAQAAL